MKAFEEDATEAGVGAYAIGFDDFVAKVARALPESNLSYIVIDGATPEEEGREEEGTKATEVPKQKVIVVEDQATTTRVDTYKVFPFLFILPLSFKPLIHFCMNFYYNEILHFHSNEVCMCLVNVLIFEWMSAKYLSQKCIPN